tara:strand:+ start:153 stop:887 length:735 start_codon:yes stop_codon:yes gene_type:complete
MKKPCILFLTLISLYSYGQECGNFVPEWYLREINVNDQITNLTPNDEVVNVTLQCTENATGDFITTFCKTGVGVIEHFFEGMRFVNQDFIISGDPCSEVPNDSIESVYFSFFTEHIEEDFTLWQTHLFGLPPPSPPETWELMIFAPNGDYVRYEDFPRQLNAEEFTADKVVVVPNPVKDIVSLQIDSFFTLSTLKLIDLKGREVRNLSTNNLNQISTQNLASGLYYLQLKNNQGEIVYKKIIVE